MVCLQLEQFFGLLVVRVLRATKLPNKDAGIFYDGNDMTDAYALIRLGGARRKDCPHTSVVRDSLDPTWDEEFVIVVPAGVDKFAIELFDSDDDNWVGAAREGIGFVQVQFRRHPGEWVEKREPLFNFENKKVMHSKVEYQFFFARSVRDLLVMDDEGAVRKDPSAAMDIGTFLK